MMTRLKHVFLIMLGVSLLFFLANSFADTKKSITSWKDIMIHKTKEAHVIKGNPGGSATLSTEDLLTLAKGRTVLRTLKYSTECSFTEEKRRLRKRSAPALLKNGPIDLGWNKLGCAKLEVLSNGIVQGWIMRYWFYNPNDLENSVRERMESFPAKEEILKLFIPTLGKPVKMLQPKPNHEIFTFALDKRTFELKLSYYEKPKVFYADFSENGH
ncbi:hypothetical protein ACFL1E_00235 [Candidatus Omnitrophota bacterium]